MKNTTVLSGKVIELGVGKLQGDETASTKSHPETFFCQSSDITKGKFLPNVNYQATAASFIST
ncbi:hypothetical protein [Calothrix sp. NIES-2098]|uniref:hypothetical protein n=1 Tax=Calothrix sp. NIES-2098 TaxID=1954171 RepID=UPI0030DD9C10